MRLFLAMVFSTVAVCSVEAATVQWLPLGQLAQTSDAIVVARVESVASNFDEKSKSVRTRIKLDVTEPLKGVAAGPLWLVQIGGVVGEGAARIEQRVPGQAQFTVEEHVLVFLQRVAGRWVVNGLGQGKFSLEGDADDPGILYARRNVADLHFVKRTNATQLAGWSIEAKGFPLSQLLDLIDGRRPSREPLRIRPIMRRVHIGNAAREGGAMNKAYLALCLSVLVPTMALAYEFTGAQWRLSRGQTVEYTVNSSLSQDMTDPQCLAAVQLGYEAWNEITCSYMVWNFAGRTENQAWGSGDGENVVSWRESSWDDSPAALAITSSIFGGLQNALQDTDIKFNGFHHSWADVSAGVGSAGGTDVASVSAHEVGHALGLGHSNIAGSTMWPSTDLVTRLDDR